MFGIADCMLVVRYDRGSTDNDDTLREVVKIHRKGHLK